MEKVIQLTLVQLQELRLMAMHLAQVVLQL
jgi:hypothetical protein